MKACFGYKQKRWYGLKRGTGPHSDILVVLLSFDGPISKEKFYSMCDSIKPNSMDHVVELKLVTKKIIE
jgi:hypothetical protein